MRILHSLALALLLAFAPLWAAAGEGCDTYGPPCDEGGSILTRATWVLWANETDREVRIRGYCSSSCTMKLGVRGVCVEPDAALGFHSATWRFFGRDSFLNGILLDHYARFPEIREWFRQGPMHTRGMWILPARQLARRGVPICD